MKGGSALTVCLLSHLSDRDLTVKHCFGPIRRKSSYRCYAKSSPSAYAKVEFGHHISPILPVFRA